MATYFKSCKNWQSFLHPTPTVLFFCIGVIFIRDHLLRDMNLLDKGQGRWTISIPCLINFCHRFLRSLFECPAKASLAVWFVEALRGGMGWSPRSAFWLPNIAGEMRHREECGEVIRQLRFLCCVDLGFWKALLQGIIVGGKPWSGNFGKLYCFTPVSFLQAMGLFYLCFLDKLLT